MLLAEDLLLLLTDDDTGRHAVDTTSLDLALAGAVLAELVDRGAVAPGEGGRLVVRDASPTGSPVLDGALAIAADRTPGTAQKLVERLQGGLRDHLLRGLVAAGLLRHEEGRFLRVFPTHRWPAADGSHEADVRAGLREVLVGGRAPTGREAELVGLLQAARAVPKALDDLGLPAREVEARAARVADDSPVPAAVRAAIDEVDAMLAAVAIATMATAATS